MRARARYDSSGYHTPTATDWCPHKTKRPDHVDAGAAQALLAEAMRLGMLSDLTSGEWPKNAWAVDDVGTVYEAQLTNREAGEYHGYPMRVGDRFAEHVAEQWEHRL